MTWSRFAKSPTSVIAYKVDPYGEDEPKINLTVGSSTAMLSFEDAASLADYMLSHTRPEGDQ